MRHAGGEGDWTHQVFAAQLPAAQGGFGGAPGLLLDGIDFQVLDAGVADASGGMAAAAGVAGGLL